MDQEFKDWQKQPNEQSLGKLLEAANPVLKSAVQSYGGNNQALMGRAKLLAIDAFKTYNPDKGAKLRTHLMTQLQPLMRISREQNQTVHVPERVSADLFKLNQAHQELADSLKRTPSDSELADHTSMSLKRIRHIRGFGRPELAESSLTNPEGEMMLPGVQQPDPHKMWMEYVHHDLTPLDQQIMEWKTGYGGKPVLPNQEIAKKLNLSPGAISQRAAKIAEKLSELQGIEHV